MDKMTSHERFLRMFEHRPADRIPVIDIPWEATLERWRMEGMPAEVNYVDYFKLDQVEMLQVDNSPLYPKQVIDETSEFQIHTSEWGVKMRNWKHAASTPEFLAHTITDPESWKTAKARINDSPARIDWTYLEENYPLWKQKGAWIQALLWFGFDVTHSWIVGTERVLLALIENPGWLRDMFEVELETNLALLEQIWRAGYYFDSVFWYDDMGYKHNQFFSMRMYRNVLKPFHQRAIDWAHAKGIKAHLHSCGDVNPFIPELIEMGLDALNPIEVKAGMDPVLLKQKYGRDLVLHGGINAVLWDQPEQITAEMRRVIPFVKESGGYIFSSDHSVPSSVSMQDFQRIVALAKELGTYETE